MNPQTHVFQTLIFYALAVVGSFLLPVTLVFSADAVTPTLSELTAESSVQANNQQRAIDKNSELKLKLCAETIIKAYRFIRVGKAQIWLTDCSKSEDEFLKADKRLLFFYEKGVPARAFKEASIYYLEKNLDEQYLEQIKDSVVSFNDNYQSVEPGDVYTLSHSTISGLSLFKNSEFLGAMSQLDAARDYFVIWFGKKPFNAPMKKDLLEQLREPRI